MLITIITQVGAERRTLLLYFFIIVVECIGAPAFDFCLNTCIVQKAASCSFYKLKKNFVACVHVCGHVCGRACMHVCVHSPKLNWVDETCWQHGG